jgi:hypothetical protein
MSVWVIILSIVLSVHLGVAIGTMIKFRNDLNAITAVKFLVRLPLQVLLVSVVMFCSRCWKYMRDERIKTRRLKVRVIFICASVCMNFMPIFASIVAQSTLTGKAKFTQTWRTVRNQSVGAIEYALQH